MRWSQWKIDVENVRKQRRVARCWLMSIVLMKCKMQLGDSSLMADLCRFSSRWDRRYDIFIITVQKYAERERKTFCLPIDVLGNSLCNVQKTSEILVKFFCSSDFYSLKFFCFRWTRMFEIHSSEKKRFVERSENEKKQKRIWWQMFDDFVFYLDSFWK